MSSLTVEYFAKVAGQFGRSYSFHGKSVVSDLLRLGYDSDVGTRVCRKSGGIVAGR